MGVKCKKILSSMLAAVLTLTMIQPMTVNAMPVGNQAKSNEGYEIYPKPQNVNYLDGDFVIRKDVNVVYDSTIDKATKNRMSEVLQSKNKNVTESDAVVSGKTNILVGTYSSGGYADTYIQDNNKIDTKLFEEIDSYYLASKNGEISILGKNTDAAFYGITSLKHVFNQMDGSTIRNFEINDYADTPIRGFIEGYYGVPWSNEDRMSLMEFGGEFKMTAYMFAPKDDLYHTTNWRTLYPEDELAKIAEMVKVGEESKTKFVWTVHPFMRNGFNDSDYENEMKKMIAKFEQLYSVGVRQFGVLGDDVGQLDMKTITNMMNDLSKWGETKGDLYDWVYCPVGYNTSWQGDFSEITTLDAAFPENVQIFWTGDSVCAPVSQNALNNFKRKNAQEGTERRSPLFWLNWPVNDINMNRLVMGKGSLLHTDINTKDLVGVVTNPMQDAEPSKISLFAIADYAWNVKGFDDDKSWADSFKYIDNNASEALHTIAKHASDPSPNGHGLVLEESEEIKPLLDDFSSKLSNGESISEVGTKLINEMDVIIQHCEEFVKNSTNKRMVEQITPYANSLKDLAISISKFVQTVIDLEGGFDDLAVQNFADGITAYESSKSYNRVTINGFTKAQPGSKRLIPFLESVRDAIADEVNGLINGGESLKLTATSNIGNVYQGHINNIIDGKNDTFIWNGQYEEKDQYYQVNLSNPTTIYGVDILNGTPSKPEDTFGTAKVQYTTDGKTWNDMNNKTYGPYAVEVKVKDVELENVIGVRYICTEVGSGNKWPAMREFRLLTAPEPEVPQFTSEVIRTADGWRVYSGNEANILDLDPNTSVHYSVRNSEEPRDTTIAGDYIGVKLSQAITLGKINILQGRNSGDGDYFKNATLEYSLDGVNYTEIKQCVNERDVVIDLSNENIEAKYVRLRNNQNQNTWIGFREFDVAAKINHNGKVYTNVDTYKKNPADYFNDNASMVPQNDIRLENNQYIGLKLDRIHELSEIAVNGNGLDNLELQVSKNGYEWTQIENKALSKNIDARYIRLINLTDITADLDITKFTIKSREVSRPSVSKYTIGAVNGKLESLFDKDRTTSVGFQKSQTPGDHLIVDLGQEIDLDKLKIVNHDSDKDYIRDGKVYVSVDGQNWGESIIDIGDQIEKDIFDDSTINESFPIHEISYNVAMADNINQRARYIKIEVTQRYSHRWININEIEINDGAYIPSVNNPTFESNVADTEKGLFEYLVDGNITTMYIPSSDEGYVTYSVSENNKANKVKILQNADVISNAKVTARVIAPGKSAYWTTLGTLNKGTNEFVLPVGTTLLDVKLEWSGVVPNIIEMVFNQVSNTDVNKAELQKLIDSKIDTTEWTKKSAEAYNNAIEVAIEILDNEYASQASVDSAVKEIEKTIANKEIKGDTSILQAEINNAITDSSKYTAKTWNNYEKALNAAKKAMEDADNISVEDVTNLFNELNKTKNALVFNPTDREEAEVVLEDITAFINTVIVPERNYTEASWNILLNAKVELEELIELNKTTPQHPSSFEQAKNVVIDARDSLVVISSLVTMIEEFKAIPDSSIYTEQSFKVYEDAINASEKLLVDGTAIEVENAMAEIIEAKNNLQLVGTSSSLKAFIEELKALNGDDYTTNSYKDLMDKVDEIEKMDIDSMNKEQIIELESELLGLKNLLVNVIELRDIIERANGFDRDAYTLDSYNGLVELIESAKELFTNGTLVEVQESVSTIDCAIKSLEIRVNKKELTDYVKSIKDIDLSIYTDASVANYREALQVLKSMLDNVENTSASAFIEAKNNFENAKDLLVKRPSTGGDVVLPDEIEFKDIEKHWAKDAIKRFLKNGFIDGYGDNTFRPENSITRAEFIKIVNKLFGYTQKSNIKFSDVSSKEWYYDDVRIGVKAGYIDGYEDNTFRPNANITREEAAKIIAKVTKLKGDGKLNFKDSDKVSSWAKEYVDALSDNNIITGYEDNTFRPSDKITRAETVVMMDRINR